MSEERANHYSRSAEPPPTLAPLSLLPTLPTLPAPPLKNSAYEVNVLVFNIDEDPGQELLAALRQMGRGEKVHSLRAGTLWTLLLKASSPQEALRIAEEIAVTRSRSKGLLVNPHYQDYEIW